MKINDLFLKNKILVISVDPGFSGMKCWVNGVNSNLASIVVDITSYYKKIYGSNLDKSSEETRILKIDEDGETKIYEVGVSARVLLDNNKELADEYAKDDINAAQKNLERFRTPTYKTELKAAIANALINYANYLEENGKDKLPLENLNDYTIILGTPFPHSYADKLADVLSSYAGEYNYKFKAGHNEYDISYTILKEYVFTQSQTLCVLLNETTDDEGNTIDNNVYGKLPAIIFDGGYKTMGVAGVNPNYTIAAYSDSFAKWAMYTINDETSKNVLFDQKIQTAKIKPKISEDNIDYTLKNNDGLYNFINDKDHSERYDIKPIHKQVLDATCKDMLDTLADKTDSFMGIEQVIIAGGTGNAYQPAIKKYLENRFTVVKAANTKYDGKEIEPIYTISLGMYKMLVNIAKKLMEQ